MRVLYKEEKTRRLALACQVGCATYADRQTEDRRIAIK